MLTKKNTLTFGATLGWAYRSGTLFRSDNEPATVKQTVHVGA